MALIQEGDGNPINPDNLYWIGTKPLPPIYVRENIITRENQQPVVHLKTIGGKKEEFDLSSQSLYSTHTPNHRRYLSEEYADKHFDFSKDEKPTEAHQLQEPPILDHVYDELSSPTKKSMRLLMSGSRSKIKEDVCLIDQDLESFHQFRFKSCGHLKIIPVSSLDSVILRSDTRTITFVTRQSGPATRQPKTYTYSIDRIRFLRPTIKK